LEGDNEESVHHSEVSMEGDNSESVINSGSLKSDDENTIDIFNPDIVKKLKDTFEIESSSDCESSNHTGDNKKGVKALL
jgi:hypothetical protein